MLQHLRRERQIRRALRAVSRQRVALVLQPGNVPVIECSPPHDQEWFDTGIRTCLIRGWVEVLHDDMPTGKLNFSGSNPQLRPNMMPQTHYRLTEGGWAVLNRSHGWVIATFVVSIIGLLVGIASLFVSLYTPSANQSTGVHAGDA
jgi:hypothetical protein